MHAKTCPVKHNPNLKHCNWISPDSTWKLLHNRFAWRRLALDIQNVITTKKLRPVVLGSIQLNYCHNKRHMKNHSNVRHSITPRYFFFFFYWRYNLLWVLNLLSNFLPFRPFLTQISPPSYSHYIYIFFNVLNPSFPWSCSASATYWFPIQYSFGYSFFLHLHHVTQPSHSFVFHKSHYRYICNTSVLEHTIYWAAL
jgi:hypothetical protein